MRKATFLKRSAALFMTVLFIVSSAVTVSAKSDFKTSKAAEGIVETLGNSLSALLPGGENFTPVCKYKSENFYEGTGFEKQSAAGKWSLGSAEGILTPDDLFDKTYYTGGGFDATFSSLFRDIKWFFTDLFAWDLDYLKYDISILPYCAESVVRMLSNKFCCVIKQKYTDMCVRAVSVDDGTGRGATAIAVVDCIGLANSDVREIRSRVAENLADKDAFSSITVAATHCHSCIDTQGIWSNTFEKIICNFMKRLLRIGTPDKGYDEEYMEFLYDKVADTVINAYNNMEQGSMSFASKKISDENYVYSYTRRRVITKQTIDDMNRFIFTPDNKNSVPTMIVNFAAHPYYTSIAAVDEPLNKGDGLSGDFVYYMGKKICEAGYNFMFFNGSVADVYPNDELENMVDVNEASRDDITRAYGTEMGKIALSLTKTEEEIKADSSLYNSEIEARAYEASQKRIEEVIEYNKEIAPEGYFDEHPEIIDLITYDYSYYPWFENWTPAEEITLEPVLNTVFKEIHIKATNPVMKLAGKLNLASNQVLYDLDSYYIVSEIGYMELGNKIKIALMPGEVFPDMQRGGGMLTAEKSYSGEDFACPCIEELFGEDTIVFGLANDAIGYIVPDSDYILCFDFNNHYNELLGAGKNTASFLMNELMQIKEEIS